MVKKMSNYDDESYKKAKSKVEAVKKFYSDLVIYIVANAIFIIINLVFTPSTWWFMFPLIIWGAFILYDAFTIFVLEKKFLGKNWEEKKIKEYMENEK